MSQFLPGDVVYLKSGGPAMTVNRIIDATGVECIWFVGNTQNERIFNPETLTSNNPTRGSIGVF